MRFTPEGVAYFVDHTKKETTFIDPRTGRKSTLYVPFKVYQMFDRECDRSFARLLLRTQCRFVLKVMQLSIRKRDWNAYSTWMIVSHLLRLKRLQKIAHESVFLIKCLITTFVTFRYFLNGNIKS